MSSFHFKYFTVRQEQSAMKVGTDAMVLGSVIDGSNKKLGLDIGAGTGVISLMLAQRNPELKIDCIEVDKPTAMDCAFNCDNSPWFDRLEVHNLNFVDYHLEKKYDLIFSNPPFYLTTNSSNDRKKSTSKHVSELTPRVFMDKASQLLNQAGEMWIIVPADDFVVWQAAAEIFNLFLVDITQLKGKVDGKNVRAILRFNWNPIETPTIKTITIREFNGNYTEEYIELTNDFHNKSL